MANAKKLKSGSWRVLAYVGKHVTKSGYKSFTAPTKKEAERLAAMLGLRRSEICALTPSDFEPQTQTLTINKAVVLNEQHEWTAKNPKSYAGFRTLSVPESLCGIFHTEQEKVIEISPDIITHRFEHLQLKLFGGVKYRFHDLRHYNASIMLALGIPNKYAMERMGHASDNMLKAVYQHTMQDKQKEIAEQLKRFFDSDTTQNTT